MLQIVLESNTEWCANNDAELPRRIKWCANKNVELPRRVDCVGLSMNVDCEITHWLEGRT